MRQLIVVHGRVCSRRNGLFIAVNPRDLRPRRDIADDIARSTQSTGTYWDRIQRANGKSKLVSNQR